MTPLKFFESKKPMQTGSADLINVIQITDTHLFATEGQQLQGYSTNLLFDYAIEKIKSQTRQADFIFLTGDISEDCSAQSYEYAASRLSHLRVPVYWIAGNHDDASTVQSVFGCYKNLHELKHLMTPAWDFIALNSCCAGTDSGYIESDEMAQFMARLNIAEQNKKQVAVIMHHHPVPVGTPLVDQCRLQDSEDFLSVVSDYPEIKLIMCGHAHGDYTIDSGEKTLEICPAISFQWKKGTSALETEDKRAFKFFSFDPGSYKSSVVWF